MQHLSAEEAGRFHGHLGPYLLLGYLAGKLAVEKLKPDNELELHANVKFSTKTPYSCVVDGVQCSTWCTLGKGNISMENSTDRLIKFSKKDGGELVVKVKREILTKLDKMGVQEAVGWLAGLPIRRIFEIKETA